jgi:hypothetical protein
MGCWGELRKKARKKMSHVWFFCQLLERWTSLFGLLNAHLLERQEMTR